MASTSTTLAQRLRQPAPNAPLVILLALLMPGYHVIVALNRGRTVLEPALPLDNLIPLQPAWMLAYGSIWVFALLPVFVVRDSMLMRRALLAAITVFLLAFAGFLAWPTVLPRPDLAEGGGFLARSLQMNWALDPPVNCFPSLHVAWAFVAALASHRVHRGVGTVALCWATIIGVSTLFTKQHYVVDVIGGVAIALAASALFMRGHSRETVAAEDRRLAPRRAMNVAWIYVALVGSLWLLFG
jgi:membrane-associated phospholipid phosphatase